MIHEYIDCHSHILPGVDDGAKDLQDSLTMLRMEKEQGAVGVVLTPHYGIENGYAPTAPDVLAVCDLLRREWKDFPLRLGSEVFYTGEAIGRLRRKEAFTLCGTSYILVEFAEWGTLSATAEEICSGITSFSGTEYIPILAHAERYKGFIGKEGLYRKLAESGILLQVNAYDITEQKNDWVRETAQMLVKEELAFIIGSDAHSPVKRPPVMKPGVDYIYANCRKSYADRLAFGNAEKITGRFIALF